MKNNNILKIAIGTGIILLIPLILTFFGSGVDGVGFHWTLMDFVIMGILIFGTGVTYELMVSKFGKKNRLVLGVILGIAFLLVWAELAVGIFGSPFAGS
jgi:hypothetical protein